MGRRRDDVGPLHGVRVQARRDEARDVGHVDHEQRADLVGDLPEGGEVDDPRVRRRAGDDELRPVLLRQPPHLVEVDALGLGRDAVGHEAVVAAREVDLVAVRQVAAVVEAQPEHRVADVEHRVVGGHVGLRAGVRLDVGVLGAEEGLGALDGDALDLVDDLAAAVVALARVALGVLVREHRADGLHDRRPREVLGRDELELVALAVGLAPHQLGDRGVDRLEPGAPERREGVLGRGHGGESIRARSRSAQRG